MTSTKALRSPASNKSSLVVEFCAGFLTTGALLGVVWYLFVEKRKGEEELKGPTKEDKAVVKTAEDVPRFPWEPQVTDASREVIESQSKQSQPTSSNNNKAQSTNEQLHFLAQMTFANGGLRAPSCPCCF